MLDLYRFNNADMEDVKLADRSKTEVYDEGQWMIPLGNSAQEWQQPGALVSTAAAINLAKIIFMEKGRSDSRAVGKMTVINGAGVRGKTDQFVITDTYAVGAPLTLKYDTGKIVLGAAAVGDVVKAFCFLPAGQDPDGLLHFELVR
jgi:hypothetical protein